MTFAAAPGTGDRSQCGYGNGFVYSGQGIGSELYPGGGIVHLLVHAVHWKVASAYGVEVMPDPAISLLVAATVGQLIAQLHVFARLGSTKMPALEQAPLPMPLAMQKHGLLAGCAMALDGDFCCPATGPS